MKAKKLTAQQAVRLLGEFYETGTPEEMEHSFNWDHAPEILGRNEMVFEYRDEVEGSDDAGVVSKRMVVVGFGILEMNTRDARDNEAFLSCGVFPAYRRKGYWHKIMADLIERSKKLGADFCSRIVNKVNEEHYRRSMREAYSEESGWIHGGDHTWPIPGHGYFVWPFDETDRVEGKKQAASNGKVTTT